MIITPNRFWLPPPADLALSSDEIHVWRASLDLPVSRVQSLQQTLAADELSRAERFYFQKDREHFIVARGLLRAILSRYLDMEPGQLRFCYSPYGKPALATTPGQETRSFNVSHSHGLALYAITHSREIGIDLERIRTDLDCEQIAARFFSPRENAVMHALPAKLKPEAFFNCWTRKEAYIKARGGGLSLPLDQFDVPLAPGEPTMLLNTRGDPQEATRWSLRALTPGPGYVAALAVEGQGWRLTCWQWPE
jgi:4'-phosphopantetheinyl transferase